MIIKYIRIILLLIFIHGCFGNGEDMNKETIQKELGQEKQYDEPKQKNQANTDCNTLQLDTIKEKFSDTTYTRNLNTYNLKINLLNQVSPENLTCIFQEVIKINDNRYYYVSRQARKGYDQINITILEYNINNQSKRLHWLCYDKDGGLVNYFLVAGEITIRDDKCIAESHYVSTNKLSHKLYYNKDTIFSRIDLEEYYKNTIVDQYPSNSNAVKNIWALDNISFIKRF